MSYSDPTDTFEATYIDKELSQIIVELQAIQLLDIPISQRKTILRNIGNKLQAI